MRRLPSLGSSRADASMADTDPVGAPSRASPSAPTVRRRVVLDLRDVRRPRGEQQPVNEEHRHRSRPAARGR